MTRFFLQIRSVCPVSGTLIAGEKLVSIDCSGDGEQRQDRDDRQCLHATKVVADCGQKRLPLTHFEDDQKKLHDRPGPADAVSRRGQAPPDAHR